jgi:hypothetical protein
MDSRSHKQGKKYRFIIKTKHDIIKSLKGKETRKFLSLLEKPLILSPFPFKKSSFVTGIFLFPFENKHMLPGGISFDMDFSKPFPSVSR